MSDFVKIKVTYPNQDTESGTARVLTRETSAPSLDGIVDRSRGPRPLLFAVVGVLVIAGGIGVGLLYSSGSRPSSPAPVAAAATSNPTRENAVVAAPAETEVLRTAAASDDDPRTDKTAARAGNENLARFETAAPTPAPERARDVETAAPRSTPAPAVTAAAPENRVFGTEAAEDPATESAALPPPVKRPETTDQEPETGASASASESSNGGSVARSQLTSAVRGREPVDRLSSRVKIGDGGGRKLFYFTELKGLNGETIFHRWEHDGRTMVTLRFNVGSDRWRAYSSKMIPADQAGDWRVLVANAEGDVLASSQFVAE